MANACTEKGCSGGATNRCGYTDRDGKVCNSAWCEAHIRLLAGAPYCRRHASTLAALRTLNANLTETPPLPPLENRGASLLRWMMKQLDAPIRELLAQRPAAMSESMTSGGATEVKDSHSIWGWNWSAVRANNETACTVTLEVDEAKDDVVSVRVNGNQLLSQKPPWIAHHQRGEFNVDPVLDTHERQDYERMIITTIASALDAIR